MKVTNNCVVHIHYTLTDDAGAVIDSSLQGEPLVFLSGHNNIIYGLERELIGCTVGERKIVKVQPAEGYGEIDEELIQQMPKEAFGGVETIALGMEFFAHDVDGNIQSVVVVDVEGDQVTVDGNHALAGKILNFDVTVEAVREATPEEVDHGHVH